MIKLLNKFRSFFRHDIFEVDVPYPMLIMNYSFGNVPMSTLDELFKDGRVISRFIEAEVAERFEGLRLAESTNANGYDIVGRGGKKLEVKTFTKGGCKFVPSYMVGSGRKIDAEKARKETVAKYLCLADVTEFPYVSVVFKRFDDVWEQYPKGSISPNKREELFGTQS